MKKYAESRYGAGIGGGNYGDSGEITINGGDITAIGSSQGAGIGGGCAGSGNKITITDGSIYAEGNLGAGIGVASEICIAEVKLLPAEKSL